MVKSRTVLNNVGPNCVIADSLKLGISLSFTVLQCVRVVFFARCHHFLFILLFCLLMTSWVLDVIVGAAKWPCRRGYLLIDCRTVGRIIGLTDDLTDRLTVYTPLNVQLPQMTPVVAKFKQLVSSMQLIYSSYPYHQIGFNVAKMSNVVQTVEWHQLLNVLLPFYFQQNYWWAIPWRPGHQTRYTMGHLAKRHGSRTYCYRSYVPGLRSTAANEET